MNWDILQVVARLNGPNSLNGDESGSLVGALLIVRNTGNMPEVFDVGLAEILVRVLLVSSLGFPNGEKTLSWVTRAHNVVSDSSVCRTNPQVACKNVS